jgi:uncharacterized Tic20 family protein
VKSGGVISHEVGMQGSGIMNDAGPAWSQERTHGQAGGDFVVGPSGRVRQPEVCSTVRTVLVGSHLWPFIGLVTGTLPLLWIGVIIFWGILKDRSRLVDDQGRELMNVMLTFAVLVVIPIVGWLALVVWVPVTLISSVRGAIATGRDGEYFRYPMTFRFIG